MPSEHTIGEAHARRLLALSRDLLQVADLEAVVSLLGTAMNDLLRPQRTLLLVSLADHDYAVEFQDGRAVGAANPCTSLRQLAQRVMDSQEVVAVPDVRADPRFHDHAAAGIAAAAAVPFPPVRPLGALAASWPEPTPQIQAALPLLQGLAELAGAAIGSAESRQDLEQKIESERAALQQAERLHDEAMRARDRVEEEVRRLSMTDVLTGLWNRRGFFVRADQALRLAQRQKTPAAIIFADIDGLKQVNDDLGHEAGDRLIQDAAHVLQSCFRASDVVARLGGDEFAAFSSDAQHPEAVRSRIDAALAQFNREAGRPYKLSLSVGAIQCEFASGLSVADFVALADKQMYARKRERRAAPPLPPGGGRPRNQRGPAPGP